MDNETRVAPVLACRSCFPSSFFSSDFVASFIAVVVLSKYVLCRVDSVVVVVGMLLFVVAVVPLYLGIARRMFLSLGCCWWWWFGCSNLLAWLVGWLVGCWLVGWLVGVVGWLVGWLVDVHNHEHTHNRSCRSRRPSADVHNTTQPNDGGCASVGVEVVLLSFAVVCYACKTFGG